LAVYCQIVIDRRQRDFITTETAAAAATATAEPSCDPAAVQDPL